MHPDFETNALKRIEGQLSLIIQQGERIMSALTDLQTAVANETTIDQSVITLLQTLAADLAAALANNDTAAIQAVVATMQQNATALAAAVSANTPSG
jgi:hypothetical protein